MSIKRAYIEITNRCNCQCSFCIPHQRKYDSMTFNQFSHIVDELVPYTPFLYLHVHGEPLMHPLFDDFMTYCDEKECKIQLVTNGSLLKDHLTLLKHPSLRKLSISLHSLDFQPTPIQEFISTVDSVINLFKESKDQFLELRFWNDNLQGKSQKMLQHLKENYPLKECTHKNNFKIAENIFLHFDQEFEWPSSSKNTKPTGTCLGGKSMLGILVDGSVTPCCLDCRGEIVFGNLFSESLETILHAKEYTSFIDSLHQNKFNHSLCQKCTYRQRFD